MGVFPNAIAACTPNYCMRLKAIDHLYRLAFDFSMRFLFIMPLLDLNVINALEEHQFGYVSVIQHSSLPSCSMPACKHGTGTFYSSSSMRRLCVSIFASCSYCGNSLFMRTSFSLPAPLSSYSSTMTVSSTRKRFY